MDDELNILRDKLRRLDEENARYRQSEERRVRPDASARVCCGSDGAALGGPVVSNHLTGRKAAETALQRELSFQTALLEDLSEAVIACDVDGKIRLCNRATRIWGADPFVGLSVEEWFKSVEIYDAETGAIVPSDQRPLARALRGDCVVKTLYKIIVGESERYLMANAHPFYDTDGTLLGAVIVASDMTAQRQACQEQSESHERLREAERAGHVGSWRYDFATERIWGSDEAKRIYGRPIPESYFSAEMFISQLQEPDMARQALRDMIVLGRSCNIEVTLLPDGEGEPRFLSLLGELIRDSEGKPLKAVGIVRDITVEKRAVEAAREADRKLQLALTAGGASTYEWDLQTNTLWRVGARLTGRDSDTSIGLSYEDFVRAIHEEDVADLEAGLDAARDGHSAMLYRFRVVWPDGSVHWLETHSRFEYDPDGTPTRLTGVLLDISERRQAEEDRERLAAIVEAITTAIISVGAGGVILTWNPAAEQMFGYTFADVRGKLLRELLAPEWRTEVDRIVACVSGGSTVGTASMRAVTRGGNVLEVEFSCLPVRLRGRLVGGAVIIRDVTNARRTERRLDTKLTHLNAVHSVDAAILGTTDPRVALGMIVNHAVAVARVDAASVLILDRHLGVLRRSAVVGFTTSGMTGIALRLGEGLAGAVAITRQPLVASPESFASEHPARLGMMAAEGFQSYAAFPLVAKGEVQGVLEVFGRQPFDAEPDMLEYLDALAAQAAIAIDNSALFDGLQRSNANLRFAYDATIEGWSKALDLRDPTTNGHCARVTDLTMSLARRFYLADDQMQHIRRGALLHDIGKMGIPDSVLRKPSALTDTERAIIQKHTVHGFEMLSPIEFLRPAIDIPYYHHERWDGSGYPLGLVGCQIPLPARIVAVADVWDALNSKRPYRDAWPSSQAFRHIQDLAGVHFDPEVVKEFVKLMQEE